MGDSQSSENDAHQERNNNINLLSERCVEEKL
jgi:hypothetical protein